MPSATRLSRQPRGPCVLGLRRNARRIPQIYAPVTNSWRNRGWRLAIEARLFILRPQGLLAMHTPAGKRKADDPPLAEVSRATSRAPARGYQVGVVDERQHPENSEDPCQHIGRPQEVQKKTEKPDRRQVHPEQPPHPPSAALKQSECSKQAVRFRSLGCRVVGHCYGDPHNDVV